MTALESVHEKKIKDAVLLVGGLYFKLPANLYRGIPDRLVLLPGGRVRFLELKRLGGRTSVHQDKFRKILLNLGLNHDIVEGPTQTAEWIQTHVQPAKT